MDIEFGEGRPSTKELGASGKVTNPPKTVEGVRRKE